MTKEIKKEKQIMDKQKILTMVIHDKRPCFAFNDLVFGLKLGPRQFVGNWIVSDRKEATKIIEKCYREVSKYHKKDGKLTKEYIRDKDTYVFYLNEAPSESTYVYEFYIQNEFDRDLGVFDNISSNKK